MLTLYMLWHFKFMLESGLLRRYNVLAGRCYHVSFFIFSIVSYLMRPETMHLL